MSSIKSNEQSVRISLQEAPSATEAAPESSTANPTRRRITKLGLGAPVLMTLASRPALAGNCLSNMLSGNLSNPDRGHCSKGWSPGGWGQPGGLIGNYSTTGAWTKAGFNYGTYAPATYCPGKNNPSYSDASCYGGGSTLANLAALNKDGLPSTRRLAQVLTDDTTTLTRHLVAAYLNASLSAYYQSINDTSFIYILTKQQVLDLASGALSVPGGVSLKSFLDSTWN